MRRNLDVGRRLLPVQQLPRRAQPRVLLPVRPPGPDGALNIAYTYFRQAIKHVHVPADVVDRLRRSPSGDGGDAPSRPPPHLTTAAHASRSSPAPARASASPSPTTCRCRVARLRSQPLARRVARRRHVGAVRPGRRDLGREAVQAVREAAAGGVDAIVHAAGLQFSARLGELRPEEGERMWAVHVRGAEFVVGGLVDPLVDGGRSCSWAAAP